MEIFPFIRMDRVAYGVAVLAPPWSVRPAPVDEHRLYVVRSGGCWFEAEGEPPIRLRLEPGDVLGVRSGVPHGLRSSRSAPAAERARTLAVRPLSEPRRGPARPSATELLVGSVGRRVDPLIRLFPSLVHVPAGSGAASRRLLRLLEMIEDELAAAPPGPGAESVVRRLSEVLVVELGRSLAARTGDANPLWRSGLADPEVALVVASLHAEPARRWTLAAMCRLAGLGRSALEARFRRVLGESPKRYLLALRVGLARTALEQGRQSLAEIASAVGYESPAAFHRAFARETGRTPGELRRAAAERPSG